MKILICGDRNWKDYNKIKTVLKRYKNGESVIITGGCLGADSIANKVSKELGFKTMSFKADWDKYGMSAGPIRNKKMLDEKPDIVLAFHSDINRSKGTKNCIEEAKRRGIEVEVITGELL